MWILLPRILYEFIWIAKTNLWSNALRPCSESWLINTVNSIVCCQLWPKVDNETVIKHSIRARTRRSHKILMHKYDLIYLARSGQTFPICITTVCVCVYILYIRYNVADATRTIATRRAIRRRSCRWAAACALRRFSCARNRFTRSTSSPDSASWGGHPRRWQRRRRCKRCAPVTMPQSMVSELAVSGHPGVTDYDQQPVSQSVQSIHPYAGLEIGRLIDWDRGAAGQRSGAGA